MRTDNQKIDLSMVEGFDHLDIDGSFAFIRSYENQFFKLNEILKKLYKTNDLIIGSGIDELIDLLFLFFKNELKFKNVLIFKPEYGRYEQSARRHLLKIIKFPRVTLRKNEVRHQTIDELISFIKRNKIDVIIFSNPGNPYPGYYSSNEIKRLLDNIDQSIVLVIDEAFIEYAVMKNSQTSLDLTRQYNNLVVLRTFSKIYGLFGLRVGVLFNDKYTPDIIRYKRKYTVPQPSVSELIKILSENNLTRYWEDTYQKNQERLNSFVRRIENKYSIIKGFTNFILLVDEKPRTFNFKVKDVTEKFDIKGKYFYRIAIPDKKLLPSIKL